MNARQFAGSITLLASALGCSAETSDVAGVGGTSAPSNGQGGATPNGGAATNLTGGAVSTAAEGGATSATTATGGVGTGGSTNTMAEGGSSQSNGGSATNGGRSSGGAGKGGAATGGGSAKGGASAASGGSSNGGTSTGNSPGCGKSGAVTGAQNLTLSVAGQDRSYVLFVPTNYDANTALPLIFAWHGLGGSGTLARQYFRIEPAAANKAILVYPTGLPNSSNQTAWTLTETGVDVQLFDSLLADVSSKYCVDMSRVFSTGHSYGAMMTNALGCFRGNVLRGIAPVAGMPPFGRATCKGAVAAWIAHGENDGTVDFTTGGVASRDFWINLDTCSTTTEPVAVDPSPCVAYQGCSQGHPLHWCVHQDNHNWPSFAGAGIWAFFSGL